MTRVSKSRVINSPIGLPEDPRKVEDLIQCLRIECSRWGFETESLGRVGDDDLSLLRHSKHARGPRVLVAAGFHGEEPAGCWGILHFLRSMDPTQIGVRLSLLPIVNSTGIRVGQRYNSWGQNPNSGFCHTASGVPEPSREGELLLNALPLLLDLAADGFLSLHEDIEMERFYLYTFENRPEPGSFTTALVTAGSEFFEPVADGIVEGDECRGGVIYRQCDGSFEDRLFHEGVPRTACTETPGMLPLARRVAANGRLLEVFCRFSADTLVTNK